MDAEIYSLFIPVVGIVVSILVFLALRPVFLWYYRINDAISLLESIDRKLPEPERSKDFNALLDRAEGKEPKQ